MVMTSEVVREDHTVPKLTKSYAKIPHVLDIPHLVRIQLDSYAWFRDEGLADLFTDISPVQDFTGNRMELRFAREISPAAKEENPEEYVGLRPIEDVKLDRKTLAHKGVPITLDVALALRAAKVQSVPVRPYSFGEPKYDQEEARERDATYSAPLKVWVQLLVKETGEVKEQQLFMGDFPLMTGNGTFIINGAERVVVAQLVRSPGCYFTLNSDNTTGRALCSAKLIPSRGAWLEFETSNKNILSVKVDRKRKIPIATPLKQCSIFMTSCGDIH